MTTLLHAIKQLAYLNYSATGKRYTLTSGQISDEYLDIKSMILHPQGGDLLADEICQVINGIDVVAGVETGGALLARLVGREFHIPSLCVRKDERSHGTTLFGVDGLENLRPALHAEDFLNTWLVEDVITTGGSVVAAVEKLCKIPRLKLVGIVAVVDREQGGIDRIERALRPDLKVPVLALSTLTAIRAT